jgi:hypothetical protein
MNGRMVHVCSNGPRGWDGRVSSQTGDTLIVRSRDGARHLVDTTRVRVYEI